MAGIDSQVGRNIQRFRASMFSQTELAKLMRDRGWKWTQPTVVAVENGERPLKIAEGIDLADILNRPMTDLVASSDVVAEVLDLAREMTRADANLRAAFDSYESARFNLALTLDNVPSEKMTGRLRVVGESWVERPLSRAFAEYAQEDLADAEADRIRSGQTPQEREDAIARYVESIAGEWQRRLHKANHGQH